MFTSVKWPNIALRLGLAAVFLWFGIDKFINPGYWLNAWVPQWFLEVLTRLELTGLQFIYILGIFETLTGISLLTGIFTKFFSVLAILFLLVILATNGISEVTARDLGLIGGLLALLFWPSGRSRF